MKRQIIIFLLVVVLQSLMVNAAVIGVSKASLSFDNVLKFGYAEDFLIVSTDVSDDIGIEKQVSGDIESWIRFQPEDVVINVENPAKLTVIIEPPEDVANGLYEGEIKLITTPVIQAQSGRFGSSIRTSFIIKVGVEITGDEIISCTAGGFSIDDAEITYPLIFSASVKNNGNVRIKPDFEIDIWDRDQTELLKTVRFTHGVDILPTTTSVITREIENTNLDTGQYWAEIKSPMCGENVLDTFSIVEKGEIVDKGELLSIKNPFWVKVGDIIPIEAVFKNTGTRVESAKLKGTIKLAGQIIKVIDTDAVDVAPGETVSLETFFNPKMPGQYIINARVLYNNKLTFWKSSILNALPSEEFEKRISGLRIKELSFTILLIVIIVIILLLLILIKKLRK
ncbi:hypothetical protein ACFLTH_09945 [Bacteroidota bacterium]